MTRLPAKSETDSDELVGIMLAAMRADDPDAYINEKWDGRRTVDGNVDLEIVASYFRDRFPG